MKMNLKVIISVMLAGIMAFSLPGALVVQAADPGESGGTDGTSMSAAAGGSGDFAWNQIHAFAIMENDKKISEKFNVTVCENLKQKDGRWHPTGHIFGTLREIHWNDSPAPHIDISDSDFDTYKQDENNLTLYVYGNYTNNSIQGDEDRYAYKEITIEKPNHAPVPVAMVAEQGNWTWTNLSQTNDITFVTSGEDSITLVFDATDSWDPDKDNVTTWKWDLDGDSQFGGAGEQGVNRSRVYSAGQTYHLGLIVGDERGKLSNPLDFTIRVKTPQRKPDLNITEITYENKNQNKENFNVGDMIIIHPKLKNIGGNETSEAFKVELQYSKDGGHFQHLGDIEVTDSISANGGVKLLTYNWDTGGFEPGHYVIKAIADSENVIDEEYEDNNEAQTNTINLEQSSTAGSPDLSIESVTADKTTAYVNENVNITVSVKNSGDANGTYVDIDYYINDAYQFPNNIEIVPAGGNASTTFVFNGDAPGTYTLKFIGKDNDVEFGSQTITITVQKRTNPNPNSTNNNTTSSSSGGGFIPGFELVPLTVAGIGAAAIYARRKRL